MTKLSRNIYILPSYKPSSLQLQMNGKFHIENGQTIALKSFQNIYIISGEQVKSNKWCLEFNSIGTKAVGVCKAPDIIPGECILKEIVATTDTDLIKDGVQAINDEFLEWFVKNPSCEVVEVVDANELLRAVVGGIKFYKITIPKKNFYCGDEVDYGEQCGSQCDNCVDVKGVDYGYPPKQVNSFCETPEVKCTMGYCDTNGCQNRNRSLVEPKQEIIGEVAEREYPIQLIENPSCNGYNEPDFIDANECDRGRFIEGYNHALKTLYTDEEVIKLVESFETHLGTFPIEELCTFKKWFNQNKKK